MCGACGAGHKRAPATGLGLGNVTTLTLQPEDRPMRVARYVAAAAMIAAAIPASAQIPDPPGEPVSAAAPDRTPLPVQRWVDFTVVFADEAEPESR